jgi:hypothetical protein
VALTKDLRDHPRLRKKAILTAWDNDFFKNARHYRFEVTVGTVDKLWYFRVLDSDHVWTGWLGGCATEAAAMAEVLAACRRVK